MVSKIFKEAVVNQLLEGVEKYLDEHLSKLDLSGAMSRGDSDAVVDIVRKIQSSIIASIPVQVDIPGVVLYVRPTGSANEITVINVTVTSKAKAEKKFRFAKSFIDNDIIDSITTFLEEIYLKLIVDVMASSNLSEVNELLKDAAKQAGVSYEVSFASVIGGTDQKIAEISDEKIVFNADLAEVFELEDYVALQEPNEFVSEDEIADAKVDVIRALEEAQTPEQLVYAHGGDFIGTIAGILNVRNPFSLIRRVCNKALDSVNTDKDYTAYYLKDGVFALVVQEDGEKKVLLSPFNISDARKVDVDVLA